MFSDLGNLLVVSKATGKFPLSDSSHMIGMLVNTGSDFWQ